MEWLIFGGGALALVGLLAWARYGGREPEPRWQPEETYIPLREREKRQPQRPHDTSSGNRPWDIKVSVETAYPPRPPRPVPRAGDAVLPRPSGPLGLTIEYADAYGELTIREVVSARVSRVDDIAYVGAHCLLRGEYRSFRADRILRVVGFHGAETANVMTLFDKEGPVIEIPESHQRAMKNVRAELLALIWIARTDAEVDAAEMAILVDFIGARVALRRTRLDQTIDRDLATLWIDEARPVKTQAVAAMLAATKGSPLRHMMEDFANRLITSSGEVDNLKLGRWRQIDKTRS